VERRIKIVIKIEIRIGILIEIRIGILIAIEIGIGIMIEIGIEVEIMIGAATLEAVTLEAATLGAATEIGAAIRIVVATEIEAAIEVGDDREGTGIGMIGIKAGGATETTGTKTTGIATGMTVAPASIVGTVEGLEVGHATAGATGVAVEAPGLVRNRKSDLSRRWEQKRS